MKQVKKCFVESSYAAKSRRHRDFGHRHPGFMDKLLREQHPPCLCDGDRGRSEVLKEQASQLALAQAQASSHLLNTISFAIKGAFRDEGQGARNCV
jgi:hypothetical protein